MSIKKYLLAFLLVSFAKSSTEVAILNALVGTEMCRVSIGDSLLGTLRANQITSGQLSETLQDQLRANLPEEIGGHHRNDYLFTATAGEQGVMEIKAVLSKRYTATLEFDNNLGFSERVFYRIFKAINDFCDSFVSGADHDAKYSIAAEIQPLLREKGLNIHYIDWLPSINHKGRCESQLRLRRCNELLQGARELQVVSHLVITPLKTSANDLIEFNIGESQVTIRFPKAKSDEFKQVLLHHLGHEDIYFDTILQTRDDFKEAIEQIPADLIINEFRYLDGALWGDELVAIVNSTNEPYLRPGISVRDLLKEWWDFQSTALLDSLRRE